jgi:hypothetical protein
MADESCSVIMIEEAVGLYGAILDEWCGLPSS